MNIYDSDFTYVEPDIGRLEVYRGITLEEFLGPEREIKSDYRGNALAPIAHPMLIGQPYREFMGGKYRAQMLRKGTLVWDGRMLIACLIYSTPGVGTFISVQPKYRALGIGTEMMFERALRGWFSLNLEGVEMTAGARAACTAVYHRIQQELSR